MDLTNVLRASIEPVEDFMPARIEFNAAHHQPLNSARSAPDKEIIESDRGQGSPSKTEVGSPLKIQDAAVGRSLTLTVEEVENDGGLVRLQSNYKSLEDRQKEILRMTERSAAQRGKRLPDESSGQDH